MIGIEKEKCRYCEEVLSSGLRLMGVCNYCVRDGDNMEGEQAIPQPRYDGEHPLDQRD